MVADRVLNAKEDDERRPPKKACDYDARISTDTLCWLRTS